MKSLRLRTILCKQNFLLLAARICWAGSSRAGWRKLLFAMDPSSGA